MFILQSNHFLSKITVSVVICVALAISAVAQGSYESGSCTDGSFSVTYSSASFVTGLGWSTGTSRTISFSGSCSGCSLGPMIYGWANTPLVEYYIGRGGGTNRGSYSTSKGTFTLYTNSCNGPNITGTGPFTQYNADGDGSSSQNMGEHFNGWSSLGMGLSSQNYQIVAIEGWSSNTGSATASVSSSSWYSHWVGSGSATFTCGTTTTTTSGGGQNPYPGPSAHPIPGRIEAENYDTGGEGVAYHDDDGTNEGGEYRSDGVDVETCGEGGYNVGWIMNGEWLEYTVDVDSTGDYDLEVRVASDSGGGSLHIEFDGDNVTGTLSFSATGGWQNYTSVYANDISLDAGEQVMRISMDSDYWNMTWVEFTSTGDTTPPAAPTGLDATAGNETVSLDWNNNSEPDLDGYNVYRSTTSGGDPVPYSKLNGPLVTVSEYTDNTVDNGTTYFYVVTAEDESTNESGYSNEDSAMPDYQTCADVQAGEDGLLSDLDGDCYVDYWDLETIVYYWLEMDCSAFGDCEGADFEPDDDVDFIDFSTFGLQWLHCNNPEDSSCTHNW